MWIVDFKLDPYTKRLETDTLRDEREVAQFIINNSFNDSGSQRTDKKRIEIVNIRKYENGQLTDYRATIDETGFHLKQIPLTFEKKGTDLPGVTDDESELFR